MLPLGTMAGRQRLARRVPWDKPTGLHPRAEGGRATSSARPQGATLLHAGRPGKLENETVLLPALRCSAWGLCPYCNCAHPLRPQSRAAASPTLSGRERRPALGSSRGPQRWSVHRYHVH